MRPALIEIPIASRIIDQKVLGFRGEQSVHVIDTMTITGAKKMNKTIDRIAHEILNLHTLDTRNSDALDFHDLAVWKIKEALEAAYTAGQQHAERARLQKQPARSSDPN